MPDRVLIVHGGPLAAAARNVALRAAGMIPGLPRALTRTEALVGEATPGLPGPCHQHPKGPSMTPEPVPAGYGTITPYLVVADAPALFAFLERALSAVEVKRSPMPDGSVLNIEARIGTSMMMIVQGRPDHEVRPMAFYVYLPDVDAAHAQAIAAGGLSTMDPSDQFYGDRSAGFRDPAGNDWWLASRIEDLSPEELARRIAQASRGR